MTNEQSWVITGGRIGGLWAGWRRWPTEGTPTSVEFSAKRTLQRQRYNRDVVGWFHTHPGMLAIPSHTDVATMRAWSLSLGRPLLCVIKGTDGVRGYLFPDDESDGIEMLKVYELGWGVILGVEHGRSANP